jgi:hypothetical protein
MEGWISVGGNRRCVRNGTAERCFKCRDGRKPAFLPVEMGVQWLPKQFCDLYCVGCSRSGSQSVHLVAYPEGRTPSVAGEAGSSPKQEGRS